MNGSGSNRLWMFPVSLVVMRESWGEKDVSSKVDGGLDLDQRQLGRDNEHLADPVSKLDVFEGQRWMHAIRHVRNCRLSTFACQAFDLQQQVQWHPCLLDE